jgi:two-component system, OmpR family, sensor kinase
MKDRLSLRARLLLAVGTIALLALAVADVTIYASLRAYLYNQVDSELQTSNVAVAAHAHGPPGQAGPNGSGSPGAPGGAPGPAPGSSSFCAGGRESAPGMFIEVRDTADAAVSGDVCPAFAPGNKPYSPDLPAAIPGLTKAAAYPHGPDVYFTVGASTPGGPLFRVSACELVDGGVLILAEPISGISSTLDQLLLLELAVTGGALIGSVLLGLWLVRVGLRPLRDVVRTAEAISGGDLMHRVPGANSTTEVGHVATALNVMLDRVQAAFGDLQSSENRLRRFVSDASHELRTPIAAVSAYAQLFKQGAAEHEDDLPRVMDGIERESGRMARLVEDLLLLARLDEQHALPLEPVELVGLAAEALETARTVGPAWPISFVAGEPVEVMGDRGSLRQVIDNLLANVRAHTPAGTATTVRVGRSGREAFVEVADEGPGISEDQASALFERFFRAEVSRSRETGGAGLGLAIVATILRAHGGRATAQARPGGGALFRAVLPALDPDPSAE